MIHDCVLKMRHMYFKLHLELKQVTARSYLLYKKPCITINFVLPLILLIVGGKSKLFTELLSLLTASNYDRHDQ